jgi:uncharacterized membrane protein
MGLKAIVFPLSFGAVLAGYYFLFAGLSSTLVSTPLETHSHNGLL